MEQEVKTNDPIDNNNSRKQIVYQSKPSFWTKTKIVITSFISFIILLLLLVNWHNIEIDLITKNVTVPLPITIVVAFFIGYLWGTIVAHRKRTKRENKDKNTKI